MFLVFPEAANCGQGSSLFLHVFHTKRWHLIFRVIAPDGVDLAPARFLFKERRAPDDAADKVPFF